MKGFNAVWPECNCFISVTKFQLNPSVGFSLISQLWHSLSHDVTSQLEGNIDIISEAC